MPRGVRDVARYMLQTLVLTADMEAGKSLMMTGGWQITDKPIVSSTRTSVPFGKEEHVI